MSKMQKNKKIEVLPTSRLVAFICDFSGYSVFRAKFSFFVKMTNKFPS